MELNPKSIRAIELLGDSYAYQRKWDRAIEQYKKLKENYPNNTDDTCVYCKQDFQNEQARNLVESYSKILNDTTQAEIAKYVKLKNDNQLVVTARCADNAVFE